MPPPPPPPPPGPDSRPARRPKARKSGGSVKKAAKKARPPRQIEYISVPKHWFSEPLHHSMKTTVRPPTKKTRRKELTIETHLPLPIFLDLMKPMETGEMVGFEWEDEDKTKLVPTKDAKSFLQYKYTIAKPSAVDKFWRLHETEKPRRMRKGGKLVVCRRGLGSSRLHLSAAAEERGERTDLLAQVTGNVTVTCKVPKEERAMPYLRIAFKVSTLDKTGHIEWATIFTDRTAAALRKQMETHLRSMIENPDYPTLSMPTEEVLTQQTTSVRPVALALMPPRPAAAQPTGA